jgi:hypothetical protein
VGFVVDKVAVRQAFIQVLQFPQQYKSTNAAYSSIYHRYYITLATVSIMQHTLMEVLLADMKDTGPMWILEGNT